MTTMRSTLYGYQPDYRQKSGCNAIPMIIRIL